MSISSSQKKDELARIQEATDYAVTRAENGFIMGHFFNCSLSSVFQPVFDAKTRSVAGHAAYIRSVMNEENPLSPWKVLSLGEGDAPLVRFDRLCRAVHVLNYFSGRSHEGNLSATVQPRLLESVKDDHGQAFKRILDIIGVETSRVIIEIPAEVNRNWKLLKHVISNYRSHGYRIAINHNDAGDDWVAELASLYPLYPDVVRLEASVLQRLGDAGPLVDVIHRFDAQVLFREIETARQLTGAVRAGADLLQGRFLGMPAQAIEFDLLIPATTTGYRSAEASSRRIRTLQHYIDAAGI
ncbi:EAL domain-containing protein (putative c-di-GMP-specific phosphodiesterase class I) [Nitrosospira multiformis]|uniref:EAL domain-containing protein (Putative c-di-GMP-specific phosphodiesterase class I) n=1 Tax=Nitrosospira multiformis TaxID=1231 RepID=A0A2T5IHM8_9PROT|nr:EAL domain-containing protein [Nitrosospira multiformis]PTQ83344.1 EAL domain-containing protein (putative c-di-GMP-specific phosphodiesterase class I) [Nitrosospira multiformis]